MEKIWPLGLALLVLVILVDIIAHVIGRRHRRSDNVDQ